MYQNIFFPQIPQLLNHKFRPNLYFRSINPLDTATMVQSAMGQSTFIDKH